MTNCQREKSNSHPSGIGGRIELRTPVVVTRALTTITSQQRKVSQGIGEVRQGCDGKGGCRGKAARGPAMAGRVAVHRQVRRLPPAEQWMGLRSFHAHIDVSGPQWSLPVQGGIHPRDFNIAKGNKMPGRKDLGGGTKQQIY